MFARLDLGKCLFIDIETVPEFENFGLLPEEFKELWVDKYRKVKRRRQEGPAEDQSETQEAEAQYGEAGKFAEFGKVVCISMGMFCDYERPAEGAAAGGRTFRIASFYGTDEHSILERLGRQLDKDPFCRQSFDKKGFEYSLVGHNIKEFDVPYLARRMMVNGMCLPALIDCAGLKPWETKQLVDTMELWKFGDAKSYTPLKLLTARFGIPSPKGELDGSKVYGAYLNGELDKIAHYCAQDVLAVAQLMLKWRLEPLLDVETEVVIDGFGR